MTKPPVTKTRMHALYVVYADGEVLNSDTKELFAQRLCRSEWATRKSARKSSARKNNKASTAIKATKRKHDDDGEPKPVCGAQLPGHPWFCSLAPGHLDENSEPSEHKAIVDDRAIFWMDGNTSYRSEDA